MSMSNAAEAKLYKLIFQNVAWSGVADALASPGSLYVALHTADPGEAGTQATNEATYSGYARQALTRNNTNFRDAQDNGVVVTFPANAGALETITHFSIGLASSGAGELLVSNALTGGSKALDTGDSLSFPIGSITFTVD